MKLANFLIESGLSNWTSLYELRLDFGPGYRVYFGFDGKELIVLLVGGDKASQTQDISKAKVFWKEYLSSKGSKNGKKKS
jgi:putative addiction module killer protein